MVKSLECFKQKKKIACCKSVQKRSFSGPYFTLNIISVNLHSQSKHGKSSIFGHLSRSTWFHVKNEHLISILPMATYFMYILQLKNCISPLKFYVSLCLNLDFIFTLC